eukprot:CAMPEP_0119550738 /NCGR_PEP_ID=MMETSP1352-20130426/4204_1 /TAXON_ID=265584 /ORGANISM="Stauroneis constricta, Strain CCMP1120" /LENGTH=201 /DNA_ID=CAMNT_0007596685 /DNA_START=121 /DNA_END=726 /DNA_ORIENTATION=+
MAPRYLFDESSSNAGTAFNTTIIPSTAATTPTNELNGFAAIEFKPRLGLWESPQAWEQQQQQQKQQTSKTQQRKRVTFGSKKTHQHTHVSDMTAQEIEAAYYSRADFRRFRDERQEAIQNDNNSNECTYGLENLTPHENFQVIQRMRCAKIAVLDEQDEQLRYDGYVNQEYIAARYSCYTKRCSDFAQSTGLRVAADVACS